MRGDERDGSDGSAGDGRTSVRFVGGTASDPATAGEDGWKAVRPAAEAGSRQAAGAQGPATASAQDPDTEPAGSMIERMAVS
jgi:hypothetical protein